MSYDIDINNCEFIAACTTAVGQDNDFHAYNMSIWFTSFQSLPDDFVGPPEYKTFAHSLNLVWLGRVTGANGYSFDLYGFWEPQIGYMVYRFLLPASDEAIPNVPATDMLGYAQNSGFGFRGGNYQLSPDWPPEIYDEPTLSHPRNWANFDWAILQFLYWSYLPPNLAQQAVDGLDRWVGPRR